MTTQEQIETLLSEVWREGMDKVIGWLRSKDFYTAPASAKHHANYSGGLADHSLNVYNVLNALSHSLGLDLPRETIIICGILHDVCKINTYRLSSRNVKNEQTGLWEKKPFWETNDTYPIGHGEKSVILLQQVGLRMHHNELMMIRWHMGGFVSNGDHWVVGNAAKAYPEIAVMHSADWIASVKFDRKVED